MLFLKTEQKWRDFFTSHPDVTLPKERLEEFVNIFVDEEMEFDILDQLDKEYLIEMGIKKAVSQMKILKITQNWLERKKKKGTNNKNIPSSGKKILLFFSILILELLFFFGCIF